MVPCFHVDFFMYWYYIYGVLFGLTTKNKTFHIAIAIFSKTICLFSPALCSEEKDNIMHFLSSPHRAETWAMTTSLGFPALLQL